MAKPTISMPNSFSNKPGFYDEGDQPSSSSKNDSDKKGADSKNSSQENRNKSTSNGTSDGGKRFVHLLEVFLNAE